MYGQLTLQNLKQISCIMAKKKSTKKRLRIKYEDVGEAITTNEIRHLSNLLDIPQEYRHFLKKTNGGVPDHSIFTWKHPKQGLQEAKFDGFHGVSTRPLTDSGRPIDLFAANLIYRYDLPKLSLVIGQIEQHDLLIMYWEGPRKGEVWLKQRDFSEKSSNDNVYRLAKSLHDFLEMLEKPP